MGEARRRRELEANYGKSRQAIYIDTVFLNYALGKTGQIYRKLCPNKFKPEEWSKKTNFINISELIPFLVIWASMSNPFTEWHGLTDDQDIDVYVFRSLDFWRGVTVNPNIVRRNQQQLFINLFDVGLVMPALQSHIISNQSFKKYKELVLVVNDPMYEDLIKEGIRQGVSLMRYRLSGDDDRMFTPITSQNISYPIALTWGFERDEL